MKPAVFKQAAAIGVLMMGTLTGLAIAAPPVTADEQLRCDSFKDALLADLQSRHTAAVEKILRAAVVEHALQTGAAVFDQDLQVSVESSHYADKLYDYMLITSLNAQAGDAVYNAKAFGEVFQHVMADKRDEKLVCSMGLNVEDWVVSVTDTATDEEIASLEQDGKMTAEVILEDAPAATPSN